MRSEYQATDVVDIRVTLEPSSWELEEMTAYPPHGGRGPDRRVGSSRMFCGFNLKYLQVKPQVTMNKRHTPAPNKTLSSTAVTPSVLQDSQPPRSG